MYVLDGRRDRMCQRMWPYVWGNMSVCRLKMAHFARFLPFLSLVL